MYRLRFVREVVLGAPAADSNVNLVRRTVWSAVGLLVAWVSLAWMTGIIPHN